MPISSAAMPAFHERPRAMLQAESINGFILGIYGSIPEDGTSFDVETETLDIHVEDIKDHKIEKAIITLKSAQEEPATLNE